MVQHLPLILVCMVVISLMVITSAAIARTVHLMIDEFMADAWTYLALSIGIGGLLLAADIALLCLLVNLLNGTFTV